MVIVRCTPIFPFQPKYTVNRFVPDDLHVQFRPLPSNRRLLYTFQIFTLHFPAKVKTVSKTLSFVCQISNYLSNVKKQRKLRV